MANVYEKCPAFENDKYLLRLFSIDDVKEMMTMSDSERILELLRVEGPKPVRKLQ